MTTTITIRDGKTFITDLIPEATDPNKVACEQMRIYYNARVVVKTDRGLITLDEVISYYNSCFTNINNEV